MRVLLIIPLSGCLTVYHSVQAGWIAGNDGDGGRAHGGMVTYQMCIAPDDENFSISTGAQSWMLNREDAYSFDLTGGINLWTDPFQEAPIGLQTEGRLLIPFNGPGIPMGIALRGGPYIGDEAVRGTLMLHSQASLPATPIFQWGTLAGIRWEVGALRE